MEYNPTVESDPGNLITNKPVNLSGAFVVSTSEYYEGKSAKFLSHRIFIKIQLTSKY